MAEWEKQTNVQYPGERTWILASVPRAREAPMISVYPDRRGYIIERDASWGAPGELLAGPFPTLKAAKAAYLILIAAGG